MRAKLMRAPRHRTQRDPGIFKGRRAHHGIIGGGRLGVGRIVICRRHLLVAPVPAEARLLGERQSDHAPMRLRHAFGQRPIDLARIAPAQGFGKRGGRGKRARHHQHTRCIAVEPMHQPRLLALLALQRFQHAVDEAADP